MKEALIIYKLKTWSDGNLQLRKMKTQGWKEEEQVGIQHRS